MLFNRSNSTPFRGYKPIKLTDHPDLIKWGIEGKTNFDLAEKTYCYNLDEIALDYSNSDPLVNIEPLRTLSSPDVLIIEEDAYLFIEFKSAEFLKNHNEGYKDYLNDNPELLAKLKLKELLLKHLAPKIAGTAIFSALTSSDLHQEDFRQMFKASSKQLKLFLVINSVTYVTSFNTVLKSVLKDFGNFGIKVELHSIDYFLTDVLPKQIKSVL